jgi:hypothetical protein
VSGLTVPSSALLSKADGSVAVVDATGVEHEVTVISTAKGMAVIEGIAAGTDVRIPATED